MHSMQALELFGPASSPNARVRYLGLQCLPTTRAPPSRPFAGQRGRQLLRDIVNDETRSARLLLPGAGNQLASPTLIIVLDLSHSIEVGVWGVCALCLTYSVSS